MLVQYYGARMDGYIWSEAGEFQTRELSGFDDHELARLFKPGICDAAGCRYERYGDVAVRDRYGNVTGGTSLPGMVRVLEDFRVPVESGERTCVGEGPCDVPAERLATVVGHLRARRPVIVTVPDHYVTLTGYDADAQLVYFNDPSGDDEDPFGGTQGARTVADFCHGYWTGGYLVIDRDFEPVVVRALQAVHPLLEGLAGIETIVGYYQSLMAQYRWPDASDGDLTGRAITDLLLWDWARLLKPAGGEYCATAADGSVSCDYGDYISGEVPDRYGGQSRGLHLEHAAEMLEEFGFDVDVYERECRCGAPVDQLDLLEEFVLRRRPVLVRLQEVESVWLGWDRGFVELPKYLMVVGVERRARVVYLANWDGGLHRLPYDEFAERVWDGGMLVLLPPINRVYIRMRANYDSGVDAGRGMYFNVWHTDGFAPGTTRWLNLFTSNADDGLWHTFWWTLTDSVAAYRPGCGNYVSIAMADSARPKRVEMDWFNVQQYVNGGWRTLVSKDQVFYLVRNLDRWYLQAAIAVGAVRRVSSSEFCWP
jgi:hypothetical protein